MRNCDYPDEIFLNYIEETIRKTIDNFWRTSVLINGYAVGSAKIFSIAFSGSIRTRSSKANGSALVISSCFHYLGLSLHMEG
jgi:hypothetical protein